MAREILISPQHWGVQERGRTTGREWKGEKEILEALIHQPLMLYGLDLELLLLFAPQATRHVATAHFLAQIPNFSKCPSISIIFYPLALPARCVWHKAHDKIVPALNQKISEKVEEPNMYVCTRIQKIPDQLVPE